MPFKNGCSNTLVIKMAKLYIIGAGCLRNYISKENNIKNLIPPLNKDFFKMAKLVVENTGMKNDENFMDDLNKLILKLSSLYGLKPDISILKSNLLNLEDVMTILDVDYNMFSSPYINLNKSPRSPHLKFLNELLVRTLDYALIGDECNKHKKIVKKMQEGDLILNYNYDLLFDMQLYKSNKFTDEGYKMNFYRVQEDRTWYKLDEKTSPVTMLKLHGSINWTRCDICGSLLRLNQKKTKGLIGYEPFVCPKCQSKDDYISRMIVPPLLIKDYSDKDIAYLWLKADSMLNDYDQIITIGYSFSKSDYATTSLFRRYISNRKKVPNIILVSPSNKLKRQLCDLFNVTNDRIIHYTFNEYLDHI